MRTKEEMFASIKQSDAYAKRGNRDLPSHHPYYRTAPFLVLCLVFGFAALGSEMALEANGIGAIGLGIPALLFLIVYVWTVNKKDEYASAVMQARSAIVVSKHNGKGDSSWVFMLLEFEQGDRAEYVIYRDQDMQLIGVGDAGVAFTKQNVLLAFDRV